MNTSALRCLRVSETHAGSTGLCVPAPPLCGSDPVSRLLGLPECFSPGEPGLTCTLVLSGTRLGKDVKVPSSGRPALRTSSFHPASVYSPSGVCILRWKPPILLSGISLGRRPRAELMARGSGSGLNGWREGEPSAKWREIASVSAGLAEGPGSWERRVLLMGLPRAWLLLSGVRTAGGEAGEQAVSSCFRRLSAGA